MTLARVLPLVVRSRTPLYALRLLQSPARRRARTLREVERATPIPRKPDMTATERLDEIDRFAAVTLPYVFPRLALDGRRRDDFVHRGYTPAG